MARRDLLQRIGGFDASLRAMEDWHSMLRLAPLGRFALVDEPLVQQRFSANSITRDFARSERARAAIVEKHREDPSAAIRRSWPATIISLPVASACSATWPAPVPPWPGPGRCSR